MREFLMPVGRLPRRELSRRPLTALAVTVALQLVTASTVHAHPGTLARDGCHKDRKTGERHCHPERARSKRSSANQEIEGTWTGRVVWVTDADSLRAEIKGSVMEIRLADIDAPERDQPYAWQATLELIDMVRDREILVVPRDVDRYGRIVARVHVNGIDVCHELVARGAAWFYPEYAEDQTLYLVEEEARDAKRGLWALPVEERVEPWVWRERQRAASGR
jgi:endonuclease YncB( thermonuclease family)